MANVGNKRFRLENNRDHKSDKYEDLCKEELIPPVMFSSLEPHLPHNLLNVSRHMKHAFMADILRRYMEETEEEQKYKAFRQKIESCYQPLHKELRTMNAAKICVPSFIKAFRQRDLDKLKKDIEAIMTEVAPGVYAFEMLQPRFCEMLLSEVENIRKWVHETKIRMPSPNSVNKYSVNVDDFGLEETFSKLIRDFILDIINVYFADDFKGFEIDTYNGFVVDYGVDRTVELGTHVDDAEITLNVCLGKQFTGGNMFFRGVRCQKHFMGQEYPDEIHDYSHSVGHAIIHHGRHRHGATPITSGTIISLLLCCKSSVFRDALEFGMDVLKFCRECQRRRKVHAHSGCDRETATDVSDQVLKEQPNEPNATDVSDQVLKEQPNEPNATDVSDQVLKEQPTEPNAWIVYHRRFKGGHV